MSATEHLQRLLEVEEQQREQQRAAELEFAVPNHKYMMEPFGSMKNPFTYQNQVQLVEDK